MSSFVTAFWGGAAVGAFCGGALVAKTFKHPFFTGLDQKVVFLSAGVFAFGVGGGTTALLLNGAAEFTARLYQCTLGQPSDRCFSTLDFASCAIPAAFLAFCKIHQMRAAEEQQGAAPFHLPMLRRGNPAMPPTVTHSGRG